MINQPTEKNMDYLSIVVPNKSKIDVKKWLLKNLFDNSSIISLPLYQCNYDPFPMLYDDDVDPDNVDFTFNEFVKTDFLIDLMTKDYVVSNDLRILDIGCWTKDMFKTEEEFIDYMKSWYRNEHQDMIFYRVDDSNDSKLLGELEPFDRVNTGCYCDYY